MTKNINNGTMATASGSCSRTAVAPQYLLLLLLFIIIVYYYLLLLFYIIIIANFAHFRVQRFRYTSKNATVVRGPTACLGTCGDVRLCWCSLLHRVL